MRSNFHNINSIYVTKYVGSSKISVRSDLKESILEEFCHKSRFSHKEICIIFLAC